MLSLSWFFQGWSFEPAAKVSSRGAGHSGGAGGAPPAPRQLNLRGL